MLAHRHLLTGALTADGMVVPVPAALGLSAERLLQAPVGTRTMLDLIVPADAADAIADFQRALTTGHASGASRLRSAPEVVRHHVVLDARQLHGVLLTGCDASAGGPVPGPAPSGAAPGGRRPRTATVR